MDRQSDQRFGASVGDVLTMANAHHPLPKFLTIQEVADHLAVSAKTVRRLISRGDLPRHKLGRQVRISERDFRDFVAIRRGF